MSVNCWALIPAAHPGRFFPEEPFDRPEVEVEDRAVDQHGVFHAHHEPDIWRIVEPPVGVSPRRLENVT